MKFFITFVLILSHSVLFGQEIDIKGIWQTKSWIVSTTSSREIDEFELVRSDSQIGLNRPRDTAVWYSNWSFESDSTLTSGTYCRGCFVGASGSYSYTLKRNTLIIRSPINSKIIYEGLVSEEEIVLKRKR